MDYDLGYFDLETRVLEPLENPFGLKSVTHLTGTFCTLVSGLGRLGLVAGAGFEPATFGL